MRGTKYMWSIKIWRFSTNKLQYLANDTRYRHSYYGTLIGSRMRSIKFSNDLEQTQTLFSRSQHSLKMNISQTATDTAIVTTAGE